MSNDPLDVMNFLKEKSKTPVDPVQFRESDEVADILEAVRQAQERYADQEEGCGTVSFTPQDLPTEDSQAPSKGSLTGSGPRRIRVNEEVLFRMNEEGQVVDGLGNKAPVFNPNRRCHLTIIDTIVHQLADENAIPVDSRYTRWLTTDEQHCSRIKKIGESWEPLDTGWIEDCGMLMIKNKEGGRKLVNPSIEEQEKEKTKVVEVATTVFITGKMVEIPFAMILPGESLRLQPVNLESYRIRCRSGECRISVDAFPV